MLEIMSQEPPTPSAGTQSGMNDALASVVKVYVESLMKDKSRLSISPLAVLPTLIFFATATSVPMRNQIHCPKKISRLWDVCMDDRGIHS